MSMNIYMDFSKIFDSISCGMLITKVKEYRSKGEWQM